MSSLALVGSAPAPAATAALSVTDEDGEILATALFQAAPGERNDVSVRAVYRNGQSRGALFHDSGAVLVASAPCQTVDQHTAMCTAAPEQYFSYTRLELGDLDDRFRSVAAPAESEDELGDFAVFGGPGNDVLTANQGFAALAGGEGDDQLRVRRNVSEGSLDGGAGDDEIWAAARTSSEVDGGGGRDVMHGGETMRDGDQEGAGGDMGPGPDVFDATPSPDVLVSYSDRHAPVRVDLRRGVGGEAGEGDTFIGVRNVDGGAGDDRLLGDSGRNVLRGGPGFDRLWARGGDDELWPGRGGSRLSCGAGTDEVWATSSKDRLATNCDLVGNTPTRPIPTQIGLRYPVRCQEQTDEEGTTSGPGECSSWLHVWEAEGRERLLAKGAIPLGRWRKRTIPLTLTAAGRRRAAHRRIVTATLKFHMQENGSSFTWRWTTRVGLRRSR